ncbi:MAG: hypothetical protein E7105_00205 [Prevotella sp.]|nr:hypothetical protein [Prevotella sp.]
MSLKEKLEHTRQKFQKAKDGLARGMGYATAGSFVDGITGDDSADRRLEESADNIAEIPIIGGDTTRFVAEKSLKWVSNGFNRLGKITRGREE